MSGAAIVQVVTTADGPATRAALQSVSAAPTLLAAIERAADVESAAAADGPACELVLAAALADDDHLVAIAAAHAAGAAGAETAARLLLPLLDADAGFLREHAAWALAKAPRLPDGVARLHTLRTAGGLTGALAEATLEAWGDLPVDEDVPDVARSRASSELPDLPEPPEPDESDILPSVPLGLTVAQLFLHAQIDGSLQHAGQGETGGIATLLVQLGDALLGQPGIGRVLTISRAAPEVGFPAEPDRADLARPAHHYLGVRLPGQPVPAAEAWPLRRPVRSALRRLLRQAGPVDVLHLRMADVGSWAAAQVAAELGIPIVLTLAPDPHALIAAREAAGTLTRATFGAVDAAEHLFFRVRLLRDLSDQAAHAVVFPRPNLAGDLRALLHVDPDDPAARITVVEEGIDLAPIDRAGRAVADALRGDPVPAETAAALAALDEVLDTLPPERRRLPLALSVGRLHRVKGMASLVGAWQSDPRTAGGCNLLIVGGDLDHPTRDEDAQLELIDALIPRDQGPSRGLLLAGHRPNPAVAVWLAAVRRGRPGRCAPNGVYVCASHKEEFGIAILEAMASGLVVVAPCEGGPATYVEPGVTGLLVDTHDPDALATGLASALALAKAPDAAERAGRAEALISERYSIETMAAVLATVYSEVSRDAAHHQS